LFSIFLISICRRELVELVWPIALILTILGMPHSGGSWIFFASSLSCSQLVAFWLVVGFLEYRSVELVVLLDISLCRQCLDACRDVVGVLAPPIRPVFVSWPVAFRLLTMLILFRAEIRQSCSAQMLFPVCR
jgi:hypothetical protein